MMRMQHEQLAHDDMVRIMAQHFLDQNYSVYADIPGFSSPPLVNGHRPDVAIYNMGRLIIIVEVETESTYASSHAYDQFKAFSGILGVEFHATVPSAVIARARNTVANWGIYPSQWWQI